MKKVVGPKSPYGVWTTGSPSRACVAAAISSAYEPTRARVFGTDGTPGLGGQAGGHGLGVDVPSESGRGMRDAQAEL